MKVRLVLEVGPFERYVIARYLAVGGTGQDKARRLATRTQVRRFAKAALQTQAVQQSLDLFGRARTTARRLREGGSVPREVLAQPAEQDRELPWE